MINKNRLFILSAGRVAAIDKKTGDIVWEIKLKQYIKASLAYSIGQISLEGDKLYIGITGIILCLNARDGSLLWKNELKGWGYHYVSMTTGSTVDADAAYQQQMATSVTASAAAI